MDTSADGQILLVGEGDFSFCVALVTKLPCHTHACMTATSLESETSIKKHKNAAENIQWLQERDVAVHLDTDATLLHTDPRFVGRQFSRVIFNFPHVGGKSNHKKNRQLLNDFFCSAVQVLSTDGQIMMTLCKGQGGTPADRPMRAWHDSWQVVSMAANAGLVLVEVVPFDIEDYTTYTSTGFRSLDKGFHTENALTHVFEMRPAVPLPGDSRDKQLVIGGVVYRCPAYLHNKLLALRSIYNNRYHPVRRVCNVLMEHFSSMTTLNCHTVNYRGIWTPVVDTSITPINSNSLVVDVGTESSTTSCSHLLEKNRFKLTKCGDYVLDGDSIPDIDDLVSSDCITDDDIFFKAGYQDVDVRGKVLPTNGEVVIQYGPIFEPCLIAECLSTVTFHMTVTWLLPWDSCENEKSSRKQEFETFTVFLVQLLNKMVKQDNLIVKYVAKKDVLNELYKAPTASEVENNSLIGILICIDQADNLECAEQGESETPSNGANAKIGKLFLHYSTKDDLLNYYVTLNLDLSKLAVYRYQIKDERLLWSQDQSVLKQFEDIGMVDKASNVERNHAENRLPVQTNSEEDQQADIDNSAATNDSQDMDHKSHHSEGKVHSDSPKMDHEPRRSDRQCQSFDKLRADSGYGIIKSPSLYPMTFKHDMSFWENGDVEFDEVSYCNVIRDVAGDSVIAVELLDTFHDVASRRTSRCYRLTFQSVDKALAYNTSWRLQSVIRLEVERCLKITLR